MTWAKFSAVLIALAAFAPPAFASEDSNSSPSALIPVAAHAAGLDGTFWKTDVYVRFDSAGDEPDVVSLTFFKQGRELGISKSLPRTEATAVFRDVVDSVFGETGVGFITVSTGCSRAPCFYRVEAWAETYTDGPCGRMVQMEEPQTGSSRWCAPLPVEVSERERVSVGLVSRSTVPVSVDVSFEPSGGGERAVNTLILGPHSSTRFSLDALAGGSQAGAVDVSYDPPAYSEDIFVLLYLSVVDNLTGAGRFSTSTCGLLRNW